ncbi:P-loop containing nucleoside triphosphate hydrolase protein [Rhizopogon salebrosus TDB-379]|nr:P-loop containing nucleoside triphosphate hydrolase protein [Rhizopogon salebrosus TDB-379]
MSSSAGRGLSPNAAIGEPSPPIETCNVVIFGETGVGKSSLVNLITGGRVPHEISPDASGRITETTVHDHEVAFQNKLLKLKLFDTPGLGAGSEHVVPAQEAESFFQKHLRKLKQENQIHLLMYCVRSARKATLRRNYDLVQSKFKEVPIALVVTGLEYQSPDMEAWWTNNNNFLSSQQMTFAGHACITTVTLGDDDDAWVKERHAQSCRAVCDLIGQHRLPSVNGFHGMGDENLVKTINTNTGTASCTSMSTKNVVVFGEQGSGKSSVINLMAGSDRAETSPGTEPCTMQWQEYPIAFDDRVYKVFDTAGIEDPQLDMKEYLDIIVNAYNLITKLNQEGGIDLLLFCVRAGRVSTTLQTNYRLFYEWLCEKKAPIVLVLTNLEREPNSMDDWWTRNKHTFAKYEIRVTGHACITAANDPDGRFKHLYEESRRLVRNLVRTHTQGEGGTWDGGEGSLTMILRKLRELLQGKPRKRDIVDVLTNRCHIPLEAAKQLAGNIRSDSTIDEL